MPRTYQKNLRGRRMCLYTEENLQKAVNAVKDGLKSQKQASKDFGIPRGTLQNRLKGLHGKAQGGQPVFTAEEEASLVDNIVTSSDWGFPLDKTDLCLFAKDVLDKVGRTELRFKNNVPGPDWATSFLTRHRQELARRLAINRAIGRAKVTKEVVKEFFEHLSEAIEDVPPENIFNYDETGMTDDPGRSKMIFRKGCKNPERIMNSTKTNTSVMWCGSASGVILPPYVVYKAEGEPRLNWTQRGPIKGGLCDVRCCKNGTQYGATKSGWFDMVQFQNFFVKVFLPHAKRLQGTKVMIGDNLSSHFSLEVLEVCRENNIKFVCLPANSTHLLQPWDVAVFGPMKKEWRKVVKKYRLENDNKSIPKSHFPSKLTELIDNCATRLQENLQSGFRASGLYDEAMENRKTNVDRIIGKLPNDAPVTKHVSQTLIDFLKEMRTPVTKKRDARGKYKNVVAGKPILPETLNPDAGECSGGGSATGRGRRQPVDDVENMDDLDESDEDDPIDDWPFEHLEPVMGPPDIAYHRDIIVVAYDEKIGNFKWFLGEADKCTKHGDITVNFMASKGEPKTTFFWPSRKDVLQECPVKNVLGKLKKAPEWRADGSTGTRVKGCYYITEDICDEIDEALIRFLKIKGF